MRGAFEASGGEVLTDAEMNGNPWFEHHKTLMRGGMTLEEIGLVRWRGSGGAVAFAPVAPAKGAETGGQTALAKEIMEKWDFDYAPAYAVGGRELHHIIFLMFDKGDNAEAARAEKCMEEMVTRFGEKGWCAYRSSVSTMDLVAGQYGEANRQVNARLKDALDPNPYHRARQAGDRMMKKLRPLLAGLACTALAAATPLAAQDTPLTVEVLRTSAGSLHSNAALIMGETDAVLVDPPFTKADAHRIAAHGAG